jgi:HPt (histidine-containing phosphotransfer) domain-containing protein
MAAKSAIAVDLRPTPAAETIDCHHLARATLGDASLEREVLQLFNRQSELLLARMNDAPEAAIATLAHTLKGSARGIGAWQVAEAAEAVETAAGSHDQKRLARAHDQLAAAVSRASTAIAALLRRH